MTKESVKQLFSDRLRELANEGVGRIEREAREDFAEHLRPLILDYLANSDHICYNHRAEWEKSEVRDTIANIIDSLLEEMAED